MPGHDAASATAITYADLAALPPVIAATTADRILGIGTTLGRQLRAQGRYPVPLLAGLGRHHKVSTGALLAYLGLPAASPGTSALGPAMISASTASDHQQENR